jgi:uncharacterized DUF497 family protein
MEFEWDEAKSDACLEARGFDFAYAASAFADPNRMIRRDNRYGYGEDRSAASRGVCLLSSSPRERTRCESFQREKPISAR